MNTWSNVLYDVKKMSFFTKMMNFIQKRRLYGHIIHPNSDEVFNVFKFTNFENIKVVILGQDPYCNFNQANGLAFSVNKGIIIPPSLKNIYKELHQDVNNFNIPKHGCLKSWSDQGVLLLNSILTVEHKKPNSHANIGWEIFTDIIIKIINYHLKGIIFLLWGFYAQKKIKFINTNKHFVLKTYHPSPSSTKNKFLGCKHFSKTNFILKKIIKKPINWKSIMI
ncbi:MAG: uracil-DNA glycosylase [Candidatus Makana argininalis]